MRSNDQTTCPALLEGKSIAIVGGGPAGLTLARLLQLAGADVAVYDADASIENRNQGGALDLHEQSGQLAMRRAGLIDEFFAASRPEGQATKVLDKAGKTYIDFKPEDQTSKAPEIDRGLLRAILANSLAAGTIEWGRRLQQAEHAPGGGVNLTFADGSIARADIVIGADGAWSKVRPMISALRPHYSGVSFIESRITDVDYRYPQVSELVGHGAIMVTSDNRAVLAQRNGDGHIRIYATFRQPEDWFETSGFDFSRPDAVRQKIIAHFDGWSPAMLELLIGTDDYFVPRPLYTFPPEQQWSVQPDVTLIGDAAHVMPPFTGKGVNLAMLDAAELASELVSGQHRDVASALRAYEGPMLKRMQREIAAVLTDQDVFIAPDAPQGVIELFKKRRAAAA